MTSQPVDPAARTVRSTVELRSGGAQSPDMADDEPTGMSLHAADGLASLSKATGLPLDVIAELATAHRLNELFDEKTRKLADPDTLRERFAPHKPELDAADWLAAHADQMEVRVIETGSSFDVVVTLETHTDRQAAEAASHRLARELISLLVEPEE